MKYKLILFSGILIQLFSASGFISKKNSASLKEVPVKTLEEMGPAIIEIIKKNDSNAYFKLFINEKELTEVLNNSSFETEERLKIVQRMKEDPVKVNAYRTFREIQSGLKKSFPDWNTFSADEIKVEIRKEKNMDVGRLSYSFKCNEKKFLFTARKLLKTANGWKFTKNINFEIHGQEEEPANSKMIRDSLLADSTKKADEMIMQMQAELQRMADSLAMVIQMEQDSIQKAEEVKKANPKKKNPK